MYLTDQSVFYRQTALHKIAFRLFSTRSRMNRDAVKAKDDNQKFMEIVPKLDDEKTYKAGDRFEFEVTFTADTKNIPSLVLHMYYDNSMLKWDGLYANTVLGFKVPGTELEDETLLNETLWQSFDKKCSSERICEGELGQIYESTDITHTNHFVKGDDSLSEVMVSWWRNPRQAQGYGTFSGGHKGFIEYVPDKLKLFKTSFTLLDDFEDTSIKFYIQGNSNDLDFSQYGFKTYPIMIEKN